MSNFLVGTNLADVQLDKFSGNASTVAFTLSVPSSTFSALVRISGVVQTPTDDFSIVNSTLTFTTAPPSGTNNIVVTYTKATQIGVPNDASVSASKLASNAVTTAKILDANVTLAKMASGTDGNIISYASGNPVAISTGSANQVLTSAGAGQPPAFADAAAAGFTQGTNTTLTATTFVDLTGIPSGAQIVVVSFDEVSFDTDDNVICQLGTSSGFKVTGYTSNAANIKHNTSVPVVDGTKGFITNSWAAYDLLRGAMTFTLKNAANNQWVASHSIAMGGSSGVTVGGGAVELSGNLSQVRITTVTGTANFDYLYGSSVNIMWQ